MICLVALKASCFLLHGEQVIGSQGINRSVRRLVEKSRRGDDGRGWWHCMWLTGGRILDLFPNWS